MFTLFVIWAVLAVIVAGLVVMRRVAAQKEDYDLHLDQARISGQQATLAKTIDVIDKWGIVMTVIIAVYGAVLLGAYLYQSWQASNQLVVQ